MDGAINVLKRDGAIEDFLLAKLHGCIGNGFASSGEPHERNSATSRGLAEAVQTYLRKSRPNSAVPSDHLGELVELVLTQTGYSAASAAIKHHHHVREKLRRWVKVAHYRPRDGSYVHRQWDKSRIVQSLQQVHQIDAPAARVIAGRVEEHVFCCGLKVVTTELVEEMMRSEMLAWGLLPGALNVKSNSRRGSAARPAELRERIGDALPQPKARTLKDQSDPT